MKTQNYKIDKYINKYNSTDLIIKKQIYAQKFLYHFDSYIKNNVILSKNQIGGRLSEEFEKYTQKLEEINTNLVKLNPIYDLIKKHDDLLDKVITNNANKYDKSTDLIKYYNEIYDDINNNYKI
jgi:hypothetical protein